MFNNNPQQLEWKKNLFSSIELVVPNKKFRLEIRKPFRIPPIDSEFQKLLDIAKKYSLKNPDKSCFLVMSKKGNRSTTETDFAEYLNGQLISYCRPPWIKGKSLY